ncbi:hypothetical protein [Streptomyces luteogriseus]|uniref:Uncharacterized protein n=1 Tax=Streptomyces luteogriseus TaxID=68233 RepID=A0A7W7DPT4_9ACTN|nr:hypothetical protein [Streptomyces luteogriseus]MBB4714562.1 hypothetical protein [Streptomyces luteogriseus]
MTEWISTIIALCALGLSSVTAFAQHHNRKKEILAARVTAYFHRTSAFAKIRLPDGTLRQAGYHLVIWNQGPASAEHVEVEVRDPEGVTVTLADCLDGEFPLERLDVSGRYPIPWLPTADMHRGARRFIVVLRWRDGNGRHERVLPIRRGETNF